MKVPTAKDLIRFSRNVDTDSSGECWEWTGCDDGQGYGYFSFRGKCVRAHVFSFVTFNGEVPTGLMVLHRCNNKSCVNPEHLYAGTGSENAVDAIKVGKHWKVRLSTNEISAIRSVGRLTRLTTRQIGATFGVPHQHISRILTRKSWPWIKEGAWIKEKTYVN